LIVDSVGEQTSLPALRFWKNVVSGRGNGADLLDYGAAVKRKRWAHYGVRISTTFSIVFQFRLVAGTPRSFSILPR
jgi:hypothetical protein